MSIKILMPALSPTMTEGTLARWLKQEGDEIRAGQVIAEIETDKATMEVEAVDEGKLAKILVPAGTAGVKVNEPIAVLLEEGETEAIDIEVNVKSHDHTTTISAHITPMTHDEAHPAVAKVVASSQPACDQSGGRIIASPLAKRIAQANHLDLRQVGGTGPQGRIVKADVERALQQGSSTNNVISITAAGSNANSTAPVASVGGNNFDFDQEGLPAYQVIPHTVVRKVIAKRLTESKQQVPHFYLSLDCYMDKLLELRQQINESFTDGTKISVNDLILKACALSLMQVPAANVAWNDQGIRQFSRADVAVAVAAESGLITPIVRGADRKSLAVISGEVKELVGRARQSKLRPEEFTGGTFTLSNLGMFGIKHFGAIINPPQACILAVGATEKRPVVAEDGQIVVAQMMSCTLSVDHRAVDGAVGAQFLAAFKANIENPLRLLL